MNRFFIDPKSIHDNHISLTDSIAHQIHNVLRLGHGEEIILLDNKGMEYQVNIEYASPTNIEAKVVNKTKGQADPNIFIRLYQGVMKGSKFEMTLQKGTETGISSFVPTVCQRSQVKPDYEWFDKKLKRWSDIVKEASEQSGRCYIPSLQPPLTLHEALLKDQHFKIIAWERESNTPIRETIINNEVEILKNGLSIFIGPEGGFDDKEIEAAKKANVSTVSLGKRILRAETAGIIMSSLVLYQLGDLG